MAGLYEGKVAFVTGASSGIGKALALEFARQGARVMLVARRADKLHEVRRAIEAAGGAACVAAAGVRDRASLDAAAKAALEAFGRIDVVVANAGFGVSGAFHTLTTEDFRRQFDTNLFGVLNTVYATLPALKESKGQLGLVGSVMGRVSAPASAPYCSSKFAVCGLAEILYYDLSSLDIGVTLINPGFIASDIRRTDNDGLVHTGQKDPVPEWLIYPADRAARDIVRGLAARRFEVIVSVHGKLTAWAGRHFPWLYRIVLRFAARRQLDKMRNMAWG